MTDIEKQAIENFLLDIRCLNRLDAWKNSLNIFDVLGITNAEIRHSNVLAWLLDPNENHGLEDSFLRELFVIIVEKHRGLNCNTIGLLLQDFFSYQVYREANHMDILLVSNEERKVVVIENKIWAQESAHQLNDYREKGAIDYKDFEQILLFLTPDGHAARDSQNWIPIGYSDIIQALNKALHNAHLCQEASLLIQNYIYIVRRSIMKERDEELFRVCNEIYNKHKTALRLIFENTNLGASRDSEIINGVLQELKESGRIQLDESGKWQFFTPLMSNYLPMLNEEISSWNTKWVYYYWFEKKDNKLIIHLELGGWNLTDELKQRSDRLIIAAGKSLGNYRYKRIYRKEEKLSSENYEDSLEKAVRSLVNGALEFEKKLLLSAKGDKK